MDKKPTDNEIIKALERLKNTKYYLKEQYQEQVKKCPYPELKPISKQTYEDNKKAFDIAIKAIEEFNRLQAENERLKPFEDKIAEFKSHIRVEDMLVFASSLEEWLEFCDNLKAEAYNEFAEWLYSLFPTPNGEIAVISRTGIAKKVNELLDKRSD